MEELTFATEHEPETAIASSQNFQTLSGGSLSTITKDKSLRDPYSDPDRPRSISFKDVQAAEHAIAGGIVYTPCEPTRLSDVLGMDAYFKMDFLQYTGSVKERGARAVLVMLDKGKRKNGVVTASLGNYALAISYHGNKLGIPVTVVMPVVSPIIKITRCHEYNANVIVRGRDMAEARMIALKLAKTNGYTFIDNQDHPHLLAGQGTLGLEIINQVPDADAVVIPVGSGGLLAGAAVAIKSQNPKIKIIGVESDKCPNFAAAMDAGRPTPVSIRATLADSLAVPMVGINAFATARPLMDKLVVVNENLIATAMLHLMEFERCVVEGAGAAALAAAMSGKLDEFKGKKIVLTISGGNVDTTLIGRCIERGLTAEGRLLKFVVTVSDRPGSVSDLTQLISSTGASVKDLFHEKTWVKDDVFSVKMACICETRDKEHATELRDLLNKTYRKISFIEGEEGFDAAVRDDNSSESQISTEI